MVLEGRRLRLIKLLYNCLYFIPEALPTDFPFLFSDIHVAVVQMVEAPGSHTNLLLTFEGTRVQFKPLPPTVKLPTDQT
jgi:hypothetical protein